MKKILCFIISAAAALMCLCSCGGESVPDYQTMGITPSGFMENLNNCDYIDSTRSTDYTTIENPDGTSSFEITDKIIDLKVTGTLETSTQEIISLKTQWGISKSLSDSDAEIIVAKLALIFDNIFDISLRIANSISSDLINEKNKVNSDDSSTVLEWQMEYNGATITLSVSNSSIMSLSIEKIN